ncbi:hypothetical protein [Nostoc sp. FACHB-133]|uniref:hypothetical protein n=1 Tax=Nostoc sp. FACHB-133 TaxID=2692835 RepID=UPI0016831485|nr:hypothetical protein [Nostoc sp. FACHB-133]MBD2527676.1 hypothetical protein [Nostoc sp. FACHB-133]
MLWQSYLSCKGYRSHSVSEAYRPTGKPVAYAGKPAYSGGSPSRQERQEKKEGS